MSFWSWPADRVCRHNRPDIQLKAAYCDAESYYLAAWLRGVQRDGKVSLVGHSFGPRIITGALHLLAGGQLAGQALPPAAADNNAAKRLQIRRGAAGRRCRYRFAGPLRKQLRWPSPCSTKRS